MKLKEIILQKKAPCGKCPYKLGLIETLTNPCPQCKQDGYSSYEWFQKMQSQGKSQRTRGNRTGHRMEIYSREQRAK